MTNFFSRIVFLSILSLWATTIVANPLIIPILDKSYIALGNIEVGIDHFSAVTIELQNKNYHIEGKKGRITAVFSANENLKKAAEAVSGNHFNWVNIVTEGQNAVFPHHPNTLNKVVEAPWIDPLRGGNKGKGVTLLEDDEMPYFWSEEQCTIRMLSKEIEDFTTIKHSIFTDYPKNLANSAVSFETYLISTNDEIGVCLDRKFYVLGGFSWTSNIKKNGERGNIMNLQPISISSSTSEKILEKINNGLLTSSFKDWEALPLYEANIPLVTSVLE